MMTIITELYFAHILNKGSKKQNGGGFVFQKEVNPKPGRLTVSTPSRAKSVREKGPVKQLIFRIPLFPKMII